MEYLVLYTGYMCICLYAYRCNPQTMEEIAEMKLKEIRQSKGLSVPALVELSGVPRRTIQDIEKRNDCMISTAIKLAKALEVDMNTLCKE